METETAANKPIYLEEHEIQRSVPLSAKQARALRDHFSKYLSIDRSWGEGWDIKAKQYVGTIVLDDLHIIIRPKTAVENLFFMLTYAYDLPQFRRERINLEGSAEDLFEFVVSIFVSQVEQLVRQGIYRNYLDLEENQSYLRGRLLLGQHLSQNMVELTQFYQRTNEFTADLLENRILKYTVWQLSRLDYRQSNLRLRLRRAVSAFAEVNLIHIVPIACDQIIYTRLNAAYRSRIHLAQLLLQHLSVEGRAGEVPFVAYLFDMNLIFELFVARYLETYFAENAPEFSVEIQPQIWLGQELKEKGIPDIVLRHHARPLMVLDTKYKRFKGRPGEGDRNQMYMYCRSLDLVHGCLIYPEQANYRNTFPDVTLHAIGLSLEGDLPTFRNRCQQFSHHFKASVETATELLSQTNS